MACHCGRPKPPHAKQCVICRRGVKKPHLGMRNLGSVRKAACYRELAKRGVIL